MRAEYSGMFCRCHACQVWRYVLPLLLAAAAGCCCCCCCRFECRGQHTRLYTAHRNKAANTPLSDMERRAHSWDPSPAALARGRFEGCVGAMVRAFELPFAPATGITDLGGSVCQGGVRCPVTDLCVVCVRRYHSASLTGAWERAGFSRRLAIFWEHNAGANACQRPRFCGWMMRCFGSGTRRSLASRRV